MNMPKAGAGTAVELPEGSYSGSLSAKECRSESCPRRIRTEFTPIRLLPAVGIDRRWSATRPRTPRRLQASRHRVKMRDAQARNGGRLSGQAKRVVGGRSRCGKALLLGGLPLRSEGREETRSLFLSGD